MVMGVTRPRSRRLILSAGLGAAALGLAAVALTLAVWLGPALVGGAVPRPGDLDVSATVADRDGRLLRAYTAADGRWRMPADPRDVDPGYLAMLVAYEDKRFFHHAGVDGKALLRAAWQAVSSGRIVSGGSTLTMQVARLIDGAQTRSLAGKLRQVLRALRLERALSKNEILALYLAKAPFGGNIEGVEAASLAYFGKPPVRLSPGEAALFVALPQSPEARRPDRFPSAAKAARGRVLERMVAARLMSPAEAAAAAREPVPDRRLEFPMLAAHAADRAIAAEPDQRRHRLTIDAGVQARLEQLAALYGARFGDARSLAILVADHANGEILASVGSPDYLDARHFGAIDMTRAVRSPGSTLKPLIYGLAFEERLALPDSLIEDRPMSVSGYAPENFDGDYRGTVTVGDALALSLNVPAVTLLDAVGPARLLARLRRAGAAARLPEGGHAGLAIGLGGLGLTLHDLVSLYAAIARGGEAVALSERMDRAAPARGSARDTGSRVLTPLASWYVADILSGTQAPGFAAGGRIAFKTGTSYGYRDAWAIGFDGRHVVGVWTGRPDGGPIAGATGIDAAAPILFDAFARLGRPVEALAGPPPGAAAGRGGELPEQLRRVRTRAQQTDGGRGQPQIAYPPSGAVVDLGIGQTAGSTGNGPGGQAQRLRIKVTDGRPPFSWFANGRPIGARDFRRSVGWLPDGPGFARLTVVDADGASASVSVELK